jgi:hypothetical protein
MPGAGATATSNEVTRAGRRHGIFMVGVIGMGVYEVRDLMFVQGKIF